MYFRWGQTIRMMTIVCSHFMECLYDSDKFDFPMGCDDWILKSFGKKVRNWRARVNKDYYDLSLSYHSKVLLRIGRLGLLLLVP
nr:hypothetical protein [Tanacetum cinerariifolium]